MAFALSSRVALGRQPAGHDAANARAGAFIGLGTGDSVMRGLGVGREVSAETASEKAA